MAICRNCGQPMADGMNVCPTCGAVQNAAPQQPVYQQPQQPVYQQPQRPVYQQPQQPQQPRQPQQPVAVSNLERVDYAPSANSANIKAFSLVGILGAILTAVALILTNKATGYLMAFGALFSAPAMYYVYDTIKKGLATHKFPMPGSLGLTAGVCATMFGSMALAFLIMSSGSTSLSTAKSGMAFVFICGVAAFVYLVCTFIVSLNILDSYTGKIKRVAYLLLSFPAAIILLLVAAFLFGDASSGKAIGIIFSLIYAGINCAIYMVTVNLATGKSLFS